jgi:hypothetical protein
MKLPNLSMRSSPVSNQLAEQIGQAFIIAYHESTDVLEAAIAHACIPCEVLRQQDRADYQPYAAIYRCMLNHQRAWKQAAMMTKPTLIVEADFVPVVGFGQLPLPFDPQQTDVGLAWLYTCAPQLYSVTDEGFGEGFSTSLVAYVITPAGARILCGLVDEITRTHGTGYYNFDSDIDCFLRDRHFKNYIAFRNYGEHGGISNPEHRRNGMSGIHRADILQGPLAFMPPYAAATKHSHLTLLRARLYARIKGIARLLKGRFLRMQVLSTSSVPLRLIGFAIRRQLSLRL